MKELDKTKVYYLKDLNEYQRGDLYNSLLREDKSFLNINVTDFMRRNPYDCILYSENKNRWCWYDNINLSAKGIVNALTLFYYDNGLKVDYLFLDEAKQLELWV